jgi:hypothetical protein
VSHAKQPQQRRWIGLGLLLLIVAGIIAVAVVAAHRSTTAGAVKPSVATSPITDASATKTSMPQKPTTASALQLLGVTTPFPIGAASRQLADFRAFYARFSGLERECDDTAIAAQRELSVARMEPSQFPNAFEAAATADDACGGASADMVELSAPNSLAAFKLKDLIQASAARMSAIRDEWRAIAQILRDHHTDLLTPAMLQRQGEAAKAFFNKEALSLAAIVGTLHVSLKGIVPIIPDS